MERVVLDRIDFNLDFDEVVRKLLLEEEEDIDLIRAAYERMIELARPKAVYRALPVLGIEEDRVRVGEVTFYSRVMAKNLREVTSLFAYVATCGTEVDRWTKEERDPIVSVWLDMIKELILDKAIQQFITAVAHRHGLDRYATMSPGSGDLNVWPIAQQRELFSLLGDVEADTGVQLTEGFLMLPTKSVSGILYPSQRGFITCAICQRANCPKRRAPYDGALAGSM